MVNATGVIVERLYALKNLGVQLAIDDFGTGYSSLGHLRQLPFDVLKIDKTFVDDVAHGSEDSAFARAIIKLGQTLGLTMVAEGVEHADQAARLGELGCDFAQGYWFAKPLNVDGAGSGPRHRRRAQPLGRPRPPRPDRPGSLVILNMLTESTDRATRR
jgi:EAL domain-containing protein (putative c-di-GMP-specific phosphodiesterase class I)